MLSLICMTGKGDLSWIKRTRSQKALSGSSYLFSSFPFGGNLISTIVQYGRCDHRRTLCREAGSCKCRRICGSADKLCHWIFHRIIRGSHCHHFPILRGEKLETIEQRTSHCICLFYHSKYGTDSQRDHRCNGSPCNTHVKYNDK